MSPHSKAPSGRHIPMMSLLNGALEYFAVSFYKDASPTGFPFTPPAIRGRRLEVFLGEF
jgi:hypothetical protein